MIKQTKMISKRIVAVLVVALMLISSIPVYAATSNSTKTITLNASSIATGTERFAAYLFDGTSSAKFVNMTANGNKYVADVPANYSKIIFCRMTGNSTTNSWNNCWNQTYDLNLNGGNVYTLTGWAEGDKMNGSWSTETTNNESYISFVGSFNNWNKRANEITSTYRGGSTEIFLSQGSYEFKVVSVSGNREYWYGGSGNVTVYDETTNTPVKVQSPGNNIRLNVSSSGTYSFYYRVDTGSISISKVNGKEQPVISESYISLVGSFNNWDTTKNIITTTYRGGTSELYLTPGDYEFKFVSVNGNNKVWYGANNASIVNGTSSAIKVACPGENIKLKITTAGTYSFYYRADTGTISVSNIG